MRRLRNKILPICILALLGCERVRIKTYPGEPHPSKPPAAETYPVETSSPKPPPGGTYSAKTYDETVSQWKSYQDLVRWMAKDFSFDPDRFKKFEGTLPPPRSTKETFQLKTGIYIDAALFAKETLNRINPSYKAQIAVILMRPYGANHYVCSFKKDGKLFIMDYGTPYGAMTGLQGPYDSLEEYKKFFEKNHPARRPVEAIRYLP